MRLFDGGPHRSSFFKDILILVARLLYVHIDVLKYLLICVVKRSHSIRLHNHLGGLPYQELAQNKELIPTKLYISVDDICGLVG